MRFNIGIPPECLTDEHLFAESRELKLLPAYYKRFGLKSINKVPKTFTLGAGHVLFFVYKPTFSLNRYKMVLKECLKRGIKIKDESWRWNIYGDLKDNYHEEGFEKDILSQRIIEKINSSPKHFFHYNHKQISKQSAINLINGNI